MYKIKTWNIFIPSLQIDFDNSFIWSDELSTHLQEHKGVFVLDADELKSLIHSVRENAILGNTNEEIFDIITEK